MNRVAPSAPQIGFDRFIPLAWISLSLAVRSEQVPEAELNAQLEVAGLGREARVKTRTKLNALALSPRGDAKDFVDRGISLLGLAPSREEIATFAWGSAVVSYPFFGRVSELIGRLTALQGDCSAAEVHRRMSEDFGEREVVKRATQAVLQTQVDWGVVERVVSGKRLVRKGAIVVSDDGNVGWLIEAAIRYARKPISLTSLSSLAVLYPFVLDRPLSYLVSKCPNLEVRVTGTGNGSVELRGR